MSDELGDDTSMSFDSSDRSRSISGSGSISSSSSTADPARPHTSDDPTLSAIRRLGPGLSLSDLRFLRRLGSGDIGSVYLAELRRGGEGGAVVAAKVMDKVELEGRNKAGRARTEREILRVFDHPFLPRLYGAAENERWSCLLTEFCPGGDLHVLRQRQPGRRFDEHAVRFYAAEVVAALEYIHMMGIVYRDLKPENVLVRADGHIMLTDFDLSLKCDGDCGTPAHLVSSSSHQHNYPATSSTILPRCIVPAVSCFNPKPNRRKPKRRPDLDLDLVAEPVDLRSMSFVGTHEYLAPEIVSGDGHGSPVDWWTLGVFVYELLYGATPFRGGENEATLANVVARALEFPKEPPVSLAARELVAALLAKDPAKRLGSAVGAAAVKRHRFFEGVNWALLRCAPPPYVPPPEGRREAADGSCPGSPVEYY